MHRVPTPVEQRRCCLLALAIPLLGTGYRTGHWLTVGDGLHHHMAAVGQWTLDADARRWIMEVEGAMVDTIQRRILANRAHVERDIAQILQIVALGVAHVAQRVQSLLHSLLHALRSGAYDRIKQRVNNHVVVEKR